MENRQVRLTLEVHRRQAPAAARRLCKISYLPAGPEPVRSKPPGEKRDRMTSNLPPGIRGLAVSAAVLALVLASFTAVRTAQPALPGRDIAVADYVYSTASVRIESAINTRGRG